MNLRSRPQTFNGLNQGSAISTLILERWILVPAVVGHKVLSMSPHFAHCEQQFFYQLLGVLRQPALNLGVKEHRGGWVMLRELLDNARAEMQPGAKQFGEPVVQTHH